MSDSGADSPRDGDEDDVGADATPAPASSVDPADQPGGHSSAPNAPRTARPDGSTTVPDPTKRPIRWYFRTDSPLIVASRDILSSVLLVAMVGLALFAVSGVWPPLVAVESGSMQPNMEQGDLVLVVEEDRFASQLADEHGIVTGANATGTGHEQFGQPGSVIVYRPNGRTGTPIIHRVAYAVEEDENWVASADPAYLGSVDECSDVQTCPAPSDGYITRGDANANYDQIDGQSTVVKPAWIRGRAVSRAPYLGCIRLALSEGGTCGA